MTSQKYSCKFKLKPTDRPYNRFLWRDLKTEEYPDVFEFERVVFGVNSSPFLVRFVTQQHAREHHAEVPLRADTVLKSTYMDDSMDSVPDYWNRIVQTALEIMGYGRNVCEEVVV